MNKQLRQDIALYNLREGFQNILKESWGNLSLGYGQNYNSSMREPYFEYKILPLSTNLSGKGNKKLSKGELNTYVIKQGDYVSGICPIDEKKHWGIIQKMFIPEGDTDIQWIFILDRDTAIITALYPDTIKIAERTGKNENEYIIQ